MTRVWDVPVHDSTRVRDVRVAAEAASAYAGLDDKRTHAASLVATELATNLLKHAGGGQVLVETVNPRSADRYCAPGVLPSVQILTVDHGPGIRDIAAALGDGYSTTGSLGAGLGTCRRIADQFDLYSTPGRGTLALARITTSRAPGVAPEPEGLPARAGGLHVSLSAAEHSGDAWACAVTGSRMTLMVADGLGHGPEAVCAHPDRDADNAAFGDRRVEHADLAVFLLQPRGRAEHAAEIADILAHHDHVGIARHHHVERRVDRLDHVHAGGGARGSFGRFVHRIAHNPSPIGRGREPRSGGRVRAG